MVRYNKYFLDPQNIVEFSSSEQPTTENNLCLEDFAHLTNDTILKLLSSRVISSKISFGACNNSSSISNIADSDIICALELKSVPNQNENIQFKISINELTNTLIDNNSNFLITSDKIEEIVLVSRSLQTLANYLKYFIDKNSSLINRKIERDTPAW